MTPAEAMERARDLVADAGTICALLGQLHLRGNCQALERALDRTAREIPKTQATAALIDLGKSPTPFRLADLKAAAANLSVPDATTDTDL